jgi:hypothetical protein
MKNHRRLCTLLVAAFAIPACGGLETVDSNADNGSGGTTGSTSGTGGTTGAGGASITITLPSGTAGAAGSAAGDPAGVFPPMTIDGTSGGYSLPPGIDGTSVPPAIVDGSGSSLSGPAASAPSSETTTSPIDAQPAIYGQMTAGTWDDNLNFSFYSTYLAAEAEAQLAGLPVIPRGDRMVILVKSADAQPVAGVLVTVADTQDHVWTSTTGAEGRVLYFPAWAGVAPGAALGITATLGTLSATATATAAAGTVEIDLAQTALPQVAALDLAFLIDTTGSMGDELSYLQRELDNIVGGIATQFPGFAQRFALILYRDTGDAYVVRSFDFTADLPTFRANLAAQSANGGNDMPEAVDQGLAAATELSWSDGAVARVAFWIADAPHHVGLEAKVVTALSAAVRKAVHLYPVAASGIDDLGEFTMRTAAEVTGGRYLFLTSDSGIGGSHAEPHIPCYYVTTLAAAMRRMVATELVGSYLPPDPADILRTGGEPQNQQCTLADGTPVTAW